MYPSSAKNDEPHNQHSTSSFVKSIYLAKNGFKQDYKWVGLGICFNAFLQIKKKRNLTLTSSSRFLQRYSCLDMLSNIGAFLKRKRCHYFQNGCRGFVYRASTMSRLTQSSVASWSSNRHLALGSGDPGFVSWLCHVDVESLGKALYMHFYTPLMCKTSTRL